MFVNAQLTSDRLSSGGTLFTHVPESKRGKKRKRGRKVRFSNLITG